MKILILGAGLMGPAAAFVAMSKPEVTQVILCDADAGRLQYGIQSLSTRPGAKKLGVVRLDLNNQPAAVELMANFDVIIGALPQAVSTLGVQAALQATVPLVDLARPHADQLPRLHQLAEATGGQALIGCGLEPGLTELMAVHLASRLDRVDEVHIKCGGIPARPQPPLGYKIVFGGRQLPLSEKDAVTVSEGQLKPVPRYSGLEPVVFEGIGELEAWHEGFMPWLLEIPALENLRTGTQKTIRWPGYAAKVTVLKEMGLLSQQPVQVDGAEVVPKRLLDALLYPRVKLDQGEADITLFRVEVIGHKNGEPVKLQAEMVDRYDPENGFTSMARTTAFTGAIIAQMLASGDLASGPGLHHPEQVIGGVHFEKLLSELAEHRVTFEIS